jgi:hypothetical protein
MKLGVRPAMTPCMKVTMGTSAENGSACAWQSECMDSHITGSINNIFSCKCPPAFTASSFFEPFII